MLLKIFSIFKTNKQTSVYKFVNKFIKRLEKLDSSQLYIQLYKNIFHLRDKTVHDIMIPRADIIAFEKNVSTDEVQSICSRHRYSRFPVYSDNLDNINGFVHIKDIIFSSLDSSFSIEGKMRAIIFSSPFTKALDLLYEMRMKRIHIAIIIDEYGGVDGLVTMEDIIEQMVGDIKDEHNIDIQNSTLLKVIKSGVIEADTRAPIELLEHCTGVVLDDTYKNEVDTIGGFVHMLSEKLPNVGDSVVYNEKLKFTILVIKGMKIEKVRILY